MRFGILLAVVFSLAGPTILAKPVSYSDMTQKQRRAFVERKAVDAIALLTNSRTPADISPDAVQLIKREIDDYASRLASTDTKAWKERVGAVLERGSTLRPVIRSAFEAEGVSPTLGYYVAMVESEFNPCLESPMGARGVFQFLPTTGEKYGVTADDLCDIQKAAPAAARYFKHLQGEFPQGGAGALMAIRSYNQGEKATMRDLGSVTSEEDFWAALATKPGDEGTRYVARIIAATIVGENTKEFGL